LRWRYSRGQIILFAIIQLETSPKNAINVKFFRIGLLSMGILLLTFGFFLFLTLEVLRKQVEIEGGAKPSLGTYLLAISIFAFGTILCAIYSRIRNNKNSN